MSKDDPHHRLILWFMRDLSGLNRDALFRLYGLTHVATNAEQQKTFREILEGKR